jgi:putative mycofactocin binding protein MftB
MMIPPFDAAQRYRLSPEVALRSEPFGALAYHFGNRRLCFLKVPELVEVVCALGAHSSARDAVSWLPDKHQAAFLHALASLAAAGVIVPDGAGPAEQP